MFIIRFFTRNFMRLLFIVGALVIFSVISSGSAWSWLVAWAGIALALYKYGPESKERTGKHPWTYFGTKGSIIGSSLVALVAPILLALAWPAAVIAWALMKSGGTQAAEGGQQ